MQASTLTGGTSHYNQQNNCSLTQKINNDLYKYYLTSTIRSHAETGGGTNIFTRQLIKLLRTLQLHYEFSTLLIYSKVYSTTMGTSNNV